ncbi:MAG: methionyl-tRNA formyltransferase [Chloroflexota bacterium]
MGSPEFALPALASLAKEYPVVGVVTQPDRPAGRGKALKPPPVKELASNLGIETIQPERLRQAGVFEVLAAWKPDLIVVAAFGQILRQNILDLPRMGCINIHASLLPRWRGAAPIQAAILHGDETTGVTIMKMDAGVDTGGILAQDTLPILAEDDSETLSRRLADSGARLLLRTLPEYLAGKIQPKPQEGSAASYAPMLTKDQGELDFNLPAAHLERKVRAFYPWPGAFLLWQAERLKVRRAKVTDAPGLDAGEHSIWNGYPLLGTSRRGLVLLEVQPAGKKWMSGVDFLRGARDWA